MTPFYTFELVACFLRPPKSIFLIVGNAFATLGDKTDLALMLFFIAVYYFYTKLDGVFLLLTAICYFRLSLLLLLIAAAILPFSLLKPPPTVLV